ncbi:MAG: LemA family protein [Desulfarculus sp.]|nr:LemA family protein [Pseudomonadota bacterium]MBV1716211.1 LemA family protein [Desulfarculus sp.]MBU4575635.1 LemA family protein [Pseudomonadota bacterium]MBU4599793.1 LemA family protein [Pseudomonadota bacterium]MBV1738134.1 LemA family protein [Desulfarculus sp.]
MGRGAKWAIGIGVVALLLFLLLVSPYNSLVNLDEQVNQAKSNIEVTLQRRLDLIPNLVETVKGYASHERETLEGVTKARQQVAAAPTLEGKLMANQGLTSALGRLMVVVERYPDLKASQNFRALQDQLEGTENRIAVARTRYNQAILSYNTAIRRFPTLILARLLGYTPKQGFAAVAEAQTAPKVKF